MGPPTYMRLKVLFDAQVHSAHDGLQTGNAL